MELRLLIFKLKDSVRIFVAILCLRTLFRSGLIFHAVKEALALIHEIHKGLILVAAAREKICGC